MMCAVVVRPDFTMTVELIGPFRSKACALEVCAKVDAFDEAEPMENLDGVAVSRLAEVVRLDRWVDVRADYATDPVDENAER